MSEKKKISFWTKIGKNNYQLYIFPLYSPVNLPIPTLRHVHYNNRPNGCDALQLGTWQDFHDHFLLQMLLSNRRGHSRQSTISCFVCNNFLVSHRAQFNYSHKHRVSWFLAFDNFAIVCVFLYPVLSLAKAHSTEPDVIF